MKRMPNPQPKEDGSRIPEFKSYEEEADFWDTHSPFDFPDEFEFDADDVTFAPDLQIVRIPGTRDTLVDAMARLSDAERQALALSMLGLSAEQIRRATGWSATECQKALRAARRKTQALTTSSAKKTS